MNKKGFTIVELVIVIAVIAILAAVMIPTFSGMVKKSKDSAAMQQAQSAYTAVVGVTDYGTLDNEDDTKVDAYIVIEGGYVFKVEKGEVTRIDARPADLNLFGDDSAEDDWADADAGTYYVRAALLFPDAADEDHPVYVYKAK